MRVWRWEEWFLRVDMKTKVVQHVESDWMREWENERVWEWSGSQLLSDVQTFLFFMLFGHDHVERLRFFRIPIARNLTSFNIKSLKIQTHIDDTRPRTNLHKFADYIVSDVFEVSHVVGGFYVANKLAVWILPRPGPRIMLTSSFSASGWKK